MGVPLRHRQEVLGHQVPVAPRHLKRAGPDTLFGGSELLNVLTWPQLSQRKRRYVRTLRKDHSIPQFFAWPRLRFLGL